MLPHGKLVVRGVPRLTGPHCSEPSATLKAYSELFSVATSTLFPSIRGSAKIAPSSAGEFQELLRLRKGGSPVSYPLRPGSKWYVGHSVVVAPAEPPAPRNKSATTGSATARATLDRIRTIVADVRRPCRRSHGSVTGSGWLPHASPHGIEDRAASRAHARAI